MHWIRWKQHLERNAARPVPTTTAPASLSERQHALLLRSLQRFQLGESGEGRIANEIDHVRWSEVDDDFRAVVKLWVREEGRHARILGLMVRALGGALLGRHWSALLFEAGRRAMGPRWKLLIALAAEVGGMVFYRLLGAALPPSGFTAALAELADDERAHLEFQSELFARMASTGWRKVLLQAGWLLCGGAACAVVLLEHSATLKALGVPRRHTARELAKTWWDASERMRASVPVPPPARQARTLFS